MGTYVLRRLLQMIPLILAVSLLIFVVIRMAPGDPFSGMIDPRLDPRVIEQLREKHGYNGPILSQYWAWLKQVLQGDLGYSIRYKIPVIDHIWPRVGPTLLLGVSAILIQYLIGLPLGILSATRQHTAADHVLTTIAFAGISVPAFFMGLLLLKLFSFGTITTMMPSHGYQSAGSGLTGLGYALDVAAHLALPALALGVTAVAGLMRFVRSAMLEVLRQDYVRTARSKGLGEKVIIYKHALRNAMIPVITLLGMELPVLMGGAIITESVFSWPGIGRLTYTAISERDYPVLMALNLMFAVLTMLGNFLADLGYAMVDPRIRYS